MDLLTREGKLAETVEEKVNALADLWKWEQEEKSRECQNKNWHNRLEDAKHEWFVYGIIFGICVGVGFAMWMNTSPNNG